MKSQWRNRCACWITHPVAAAVRIISESTPPTPWTLIMWRSDMDIHFGVSCLQIKHPGIAFSLDNELHELVLLTCNWEVSNIYTFVGVILLGWSNTTEETEFCEYHSVQPKQGESRNYLPAVSMSSARSLPSNQGGSIWDHFPFAHSLCPTTRRHVAEVSIM
jgi:hypothetical protein